MELADEGLVGATLMVGHFGQHIPHHIFQPDAGVHFFVTQLLGAGIHDFEVVVAGQAGKVFGPNGIHGRPKTNFARALCRFFLQSLNSAAIFAMEMVGIFWLLMISE